MPAWALRKRRLEINELDIFSGYKAIHTQLISNLRSFNMYFRSLVVLVVAGLLSTSELTAQKTVAGQAAFADWNQQQPGVRRTITLADLAAPKPGEAVNNTPHVIPRPVDAWPIVPAGFKVSLTLAATLSLCSERTTSR